MKKISIKTGFIIGITLILIAILIGIIFNNDIAFVFAGLGLVMIGISTLRHINKGTNK